MINGSQNLIQKARNWPGRGGAGRGRCAVQIQEIQSYNHKLVGKELVGRFGDEAPFLLLLTS